MRHVWFVLFLGGCNAILGIEEAIERPGDADGGPGDPGSDGSIGSLDAKASTDGASPEVDGSSPIDAPADTKVDAPAADVFVAPPTCTPGTLVTASAAGGVTNGPTIAFMAPDRWGIAWSTNTAIKYNSRTTTGTTENGSDVTLLAGDYGGQVRLAKLGTSFVVAAGLNATDQTSIVRLVDPSSGGSHSGVPGTAQTIDDSPIIGGLAVDETGSRIVVTSRGGTLAAATAPAIDLFTGVPGYSKSDVSGAPVRATSAAWASATNRFGVATIDGVGNGRFASYDNALTPVAVHPFTSTASYGASDTRQEVAIAGIGSRFAVAWLDIRKGSTQREIWLTSIDSATGTQSGEVMVSDDTGTEKHYPRVVYDGRSIGVAWLEVISPTYYKVLFRRFTTTLQPLEPATARCMSCTIDVAATTFGVAAGGVNEYGFAFRSKSNDTQYFNRLACDGP